MREVKIGSREFTKVTSNACMEFNTYHNYYISPINKDPDEIDGLFGNVKFQVGPIKENGVNGCHHEDLVAIVLDRLQCFQASEYKCRENALAITKLEEALHWLRHRTDARSARGVEGTSEV